MHWILLAALALAVAAGLRRARGMERAAERRGAPAVEAAEPFRRWLEGPEGLEKLERTLEALGKLMTHPELGGPGFLTVRLPQKGEEGRVTAAAQYPNIRESMYRRVRRRELEALEEAGAPWELLALSPDFETDSGGMVIVAVEAAAMTPEAAEEVSGRKERQAALELLAAQLGRRFPRWEVRIFGTELTLTPVWKKTPVCTRKKRER